MRKWMYVLFGILGLAGCADQGISGIDNSVYAVGSHVDNAKSHVESADNLVTKAVPESNSTGKALLSAAKDEHAGAVKELESAKTDVAAAQNERKQIESKYGEQHAELTKIQNSWGHVLQVWVTRLLYLGIALLAFHFIGGAVAAFVPGPIGAGLGIAAAFVNPGAWWQTIRDNYFFRVVKPKQDAGAVQTPVPPNQTTP